MSPAGAALDFELPEALLATEPPEAHGAPRDGVRLMVVEHGEISHGVFSDLGALLRNGDLLVVNTSATLASAAEGRRADGRPVVVHFAGPSPDGAWLIEVRRPDQGGPIRDLAPGETLRLEGGARLQLLAPATPGATRLWEASLLSGGRVADWLRRHGRPIAYSHAPRRPLADYQTVFARHPGSAEMPSAGRPFSLELVVDLLTRGVNFAPVLLHAGVSSLELGELPPPERFEITAGSAQLINAAREAGSRVIAVGTTVVRAVETLVAPDGWVDAGSGWTDLVLSPERPVRAFDGLITGWHEPRSSHLLLLQAVAGQDAVAAAYQAALSHGYRWHEFGDSCLFLR
ncbi:MAG TPA: S-adenosylmethionine:tRNA ribosyltransferase-isomerase [Candidatus Dormibacteraeota bacterium]